VRELANVIEARDDPLRRAAAAAGAFARGVFCCTKPATIAICSAGAQTLRDIEMRRFTKR